MTPPKRGLEAADVFDLLGALIHFVIVVGGGLLIAVVLLHGVAGWVINLLGLS